MTCRVDRLTQLLFFIDGTVLDEQPRCPEPASRFAHVLRWQDGVRVMVGVPICAAHMPTVRHVEGFVRDHAWTVPTGRDVQL